ncbi:MAG: D-alanyl-D-alanine carboxypeptidase/D-alanyl-D-alanine-endopeptidase [Bacteroidales bacterium]|nr:D-alanyl-D-alanine carboxypeptidase/D-alanyl-D-alanine-endopeptidase [Candidatus Cacconaster merdequi]
MKRILLSALLLLSAVCFGQNKVQSYIDSQMKNDPHLQNAVVGIIAVDAAGKTIAEWNPDMPLLTASTMKTITTGLGYEVLGPDYRFSTRVAYDGRIKDGVLNGNLYIVGGGDPTLASRDTIAFPIDSIFGIWAQAVKDAGIRRINGRVVGDDRVFDNENIPDGWSYGNIGYDYGSGTTGLNFCENLSYFEVAPGALTGDPVSVSGVYGISPRMEFDVSEVVTGEPKSGDNTAYYASQLHPVGKFVGSYAVDRRTDTLVFSNKYAPETCAYEFSKFLSQCNVPNKGCTCVEELEESSAVPFQDELTYIAETFSPQLRRIVKVTNTISNNFFAETIYKTVGRELLSRKEGKPVYGVSYWRANEAIREYLESRGVSLIGYTQDDGSGLSRQNYISPRFFTRFYGMMMESPYFDEYMHTFPGPGRPGTLKSVLYKAPESIKKTIYAKSGSLSSVRCYAGFVESRRGMLRFAILVNNYACSTSKVQPKIEGFMQTLAEYGAKR